MNDIPVVIAGVMEAHLARMKLEAEGIEAFLRNENIVSLKPWYAGVVGA